MIRSLCRRAAVLLLVGLALAPISATAAAAPPVRACDVLLNVTDPDPAGLNVRATPGGAVVGVLKAKGDWVRAHVTGDAGDWLRIDGAVLYDDALPNGEKSLFHGEGWAHVSKLGFETLNPRAEVRGAPGSSGPVIFTAPAEEEKIPKAQVLGCDGPFVKVRIGGVVGWTRDFCSNQRTTCS
jgi:hypothetical protein